MAIVLQQLGRSPLRQVEVLDLFITLAPTDKGIADAYRRIGDLYGEWLGDGTKALDAYREAERRGLAIPQLQAFRTGDWDAIPALRTDPDYAFPPVVVLDQESDYAPDAALGSCIFEIGAVRVKGNTELDHYNAVVRRDFVSPKVAKRQEEAKAPEEVIKELQAFIGTSIVVGHNLWAFDAPHLRAMGISISDDQIVDTLTFARLLYPDSLHHHLGLLCKIHRISSQGERHTALPDARDCAHLLHALGDELVRRGERLLAGFRAFVPPGSAFDRAVLQPRNVAADPTLPWELDPTPTTPHVLASISDVPASPHILEALDAKTDVLIERYDPNAAYVQYLPAHQRAFVTVNTRARLERILVTSQGRTDLFVLPDPHTLLCPHLLRQCIELAENCQVKLSLFCLYQASHNHDARTLYPLRLPSDESTLMELRRMLIASCCTSDWHHADHCSAALAVEAATEEHRILLATHESFLHQKHRPDGDVIVVDDADELQMHFAEYLAERVTSEQVQAWPLNSIETEAFKRLEAQVSAYVRDHVSRPGFHERLHLRSIAPYLLEPQDGYEKSLLALLKESGPVGEKIAHRLADFCHEAQREGKNSADVHAYWFDLWFSSPQNTASWSFCGLSQDLQRAFQDIFWKPYKQHIICGTAIELGTLGATFFKRFFDLEKDMAFCKDERPPSQIYIPKSEDLRPASFLGRRSWAESVGTLLYKMALSTRQSLVVTLHATSIADALTDAFKAQETHLEHQVLSPRLGWTTAKIAERLANPERSTMTIISPRLRGSVLDGPVDIEATGPMRFLNQRDPLVAAQMRVFARLYKGEGPITRYLLPQALLELKTRISSQAKVHIILDSALRAKVYRDEVLSLFKESEVLDTLPLTLDRFQGTSDEFPDALISDPFSGILSSELERQGFSSRTNVSDEDLYLTLQALWETNSFRKSPLNQEDVVRKVLAGQDQLVVAATGGGKSLCFQLPAVLMAQDVVPKVTLVFSPLIALMSDQVEELRRKGVFSAIVLNSTLSPVRRQDYLRGLKQGDYSIVYMAPEQIRSSALRRALEGREVGLVILDEAHCMSQWGHNFRTEYFAIKKWIDTTICGGRKRLFPVLALTATARKGYNNSTNGYNEKSTIHDIIEKLGLRLKENDVVMTSPERQELELRVEQIVFHCLNCDSMLGMKIGEVKCASCGRSRSISEEDVRQVKMDTLVSLLAGCGETGLRQRWERPYGQRQRGLIYCAYKKTTKKVVDALRQHPQLEGLRIDTYHAGMSDEDCDNVYKCFISDDKDGLDIVVATNAFGMGIDIRRLGFVIHFDTPATPEAYYQEAGRAGRDPEFKDGKDHAQCILLYHENDLENQSWLSSQNEITDEQIKRVYVELCKLRRGEKQEIFATEQEIATLANVDKEKIATILYYLEYHTHIDGKPVLERGESASHTWRLKFEKEYQWRVSQLESNPFAKKIIQIFSKNSELGLREDTTMDIDINDLAILLKRNVSEIEDEISNLVRKNIMIHDCKGQIRWAREEDEVREVLKHIRKNIYDFLFRVNEDNQRVWQRGEKVYVDLNKLSKECSLNALPPERFRLFLFALSRENAGEVRMFTHFARATRYPQSARYKISLWKGEDNDTNGTVQKIFQQLWETYRQLAPHASIGQWQKFDLLKIAQNDRERQRLHQRLYWLEILGLLSYVREAAMESTMRITFKQRDVSMNRLIPDLSPLHMVEEYEKQKLQLMKEYATLPDEQRAGLFKQYFFGEIPLV